ncbi:MAG: two-component regulator propeller domain-containing protein [Crocinitomicaceae bacterium]
MFKQLTFFPLLLLVPLVVLIGCNEKVKPKDVNVESSKSETENQEEDELISGKPLKITPLVLNPDSLAPPVIIKASAPFHQAANKNIVPLDQPRLKLLSTQLPHFSIGRDSIKNPKVQKAIPELSKGGYNQPISASKFNFSDAAAYNLQGIDVDQGLSSSYIMDMIEDRRGNLWFATWTSGVTMFNGRSFILFNDKKGLISNYIWCIYEDQKGNIWLGSDGAGVSVFNGDSFYNFDEDGGLPSNLIFDICEDNEGNIWLATDKGLCKFDGRHFYTYGKEQGLGGDYVKSVYPSEDGNIWVTVEGHGVSRFDGEGFTHFTVQEGLISNNTTVIYEDSEQNIWIGTSDSGVCMYDGYSFITYQKEMGMPHNFVRSILQDTKGNMWFGTEGGGASRFNRFEFSHFTHSEGMSNDNIWSILEDSDGNIWFGTFGAGANIYNEKSFENLTEEQGLSHRIVRSITQDNTGNLWLASNGGLSKYDGKEYLHFTTEQGLPMNIIRSMLIDQNGNFWLASNGAGVFKFDGEYFYHYTTEQGLSGNLVLSMYEDSRGDIWFGTFLGGLSRYDGYTFSHFTEEQGLSNNTVHAIIEDRKGTLYFGTKNGGLEKFDGQHITHITTREGLSDQSVISLMEASDGSIWAGTEGYGVNQITRDTILQYSFEGSNSHNIIWSIIEDENNNIWLGTERGLNQLSFDDSTGTVITHYDKMDGLKGSDFYPNAAYLDDQNRIWWGTGKALAMLDLKKHGENNKAPRIQITDVRLEQTFIDFRKLSDSIEDGSEIYLDEEKNNSLNSVKYTAVSPFTNCPEQLELPYYLNHLTFYFSAIDWSAPHKLKYQYKLDGLDDDWRPITEDNRAVYNNMPSGNYVFKVRAIGDAKIWSNIRSYPITIHPPWWTSWWAYSLYIVAGIALILFFIRLRTKKLLQNKRQLESIVSVRTTEVVRQKELVERKNKEITDSITYAQRIQNAILPSKNLIEHHLNDSFFIYQPKDIVAGDFYWLEIDAAGDTILLAAADCTGHGVPGAMVSVVCNNALNRSVREFHLKSPAAILNKVRELVIETFQTTETEVKDGMDIALLSLNKKTKELRYAGANNDLYLIRDGQLIIYPSDNMPVGRYVAEREFKEQLIPYQSGDTFYIFTDGYVDQFGGPKGKKFKYAAFRELLLDIHSKPMQEQSKILIDTIIDWMGSLEQVDDVCVIGVRL